jgi:hypothetical protein
VENWRRGEIDRNERIEEIRRRDGGSLMVG